MSGFQRKKASFDLAAIELEMRLAGVEFDDHIPMREDVIEIAPPIPRRLRRAEKRPNLEEHKRDLRRRTMSYDVGRAHLLEEMKQGPAWPTEIEEEVKEVAAPLFEEWCKSIKINPSSKRKNARLFKPGSEAR